MTRLRDDLWVLESGGGPTVVVIDDIGGRFARIRRRWWNQLRGSADGVDAIDAATMRQAIAAGWTRRSVSPSSANAMSVGTRPGNAGSGTRMLRFSRLLSIRMPLAGIDPIARRLVPYSGIVFSPAAVLAWLLVGCVTAIVLAARWSSLAGSLLTLTRFLADASPLSLGVIFVLTKLAHELGHAVLCRRLGSRCGVFGIWWFCGMPCPFVDVTDVWRQRSPARRAAVMAAGIWVELIVALLATWIWMLATSPDVRLTALHVMIVCGVSTVVFNANPLMRYDGYFVLSDFLDVANLREHARTRATAWLAYLLGSRVPRSRRGLAGDWRWAVYHIASSAYRMFVMGAIAAMMLIWSDQWRLWPMAVVIVTMTLAATVARGFAGGLVFLRGDGAWRATLSHTSPARRFVFSGFLLIAGLAVLLLPTPRYHRVEGQLRAATTRDVFLPGGGVIERVDAGIGRLVNAGDVLAMVRDSSLQLDLADVRGRLAVLTARGRGIRLASLRSNGMTGPMTGPSGESDGSSVNDWRVLEAATEAVADEQRGLDARARQLVITAAATGVVLPGQWPDEDRSSTPPSVLPGVGHPSTDALPWCRIAEGTGLQAVWTIDSADRRGVDVGRPVRLDCPALGSEIVVTTIGTVSTLRDSGAMNRFSDSSETTPKRASWRVDERVASVACVIPPSACASLTPSDLVTLDGSACTAVVRLPSRSLLADLVDALQATAGL